MEELQKLDDVFQFGFITEAEYKERKRAILLEHNLPQEDDVTSQGTQNSTGHENDSSSNDFSFGSPYSHSVPSYDPSPYDTSSYNTPTYDTSSYSSHTYDTSPTYDTSSHNAPTYDAYDTSSYNAPYDATSYSTPSNDYYAYNNHQSESPYSVPSYDPPAYEDPSTLFHSVPSYAVSDPVELADENIASTEWNNVTPQPKHHNETLSKKSPSFQEPNSAIPPCKITRISIEPKYTTLSSLSNSATFSEEHYFDDTQAKVIIYLNERYGAFQFIMEPDLTLGSILKSLGITNASLMQLDLTKKEQPLSDSQDYISSNIILSDESQKIAPGHYKLIRNFSVFHRGRWHLKVDRQSYEFKFKPGEYSTFIHNDIIVPSTESRWQSLERFNKDRVRADINWDNWNTYRQPPPVALCKEVSIRKTKCSFSGDLNPENSLPHFLIRLRALESKWGKTNETLAIQKIKKSLSERVCYICGESVHTALPFCAEHSDELLSGLFSSETVSMYFAEYVAPEKEIEPAKEGKKKSTSPSEATGLYEKHMKKADQYRYADFSGKMMNLDYRSKLVETTQETLRLSLQKAAL